MVCNARISSEMVRPPSWSSWPLLCWRASCRFVLRSVGLSTIRSSRKTLVQRGPAIDTATNMIAPSKLNTNTCSAHRRNCGRQRVLFSSVVLSEGNCGRVLNISPHGLALQTDTQLVAEEYPLRLKFSPSLPWVEAKGRVAWKDDSKNMVGIEFIGLTDDVQKQIQTWMDWRKELSEPSKTELVANTEWTDGSGSRAWIATSQQIPPVVLPPAGESINPDVENQNSLDITAPELVLAPLEPANLSAENQSLPSTIETVRDQIKTRDLPKTGDMNIARGTSNQVKLVALALVIILLLATVFLRRNHLQTSSNNPQIKEMVRAPRRSASPAQATLPAANPLAASSSTISSAASPRDPHVPSSDLKPRATGPAFVLQVAAMLHEENAKELAATLRELNFPAFVMKLPKERFHRVLVGPCNSASAAIETQNNLEQRGYKPIRTELKVSSH